MRMKFNKSSQLLLVCAASLLLAGLMSACSQVTQTLTVDFVYVSSSQAAGAHSDGEINVFEVNSESGRMRQIPTSPFPSGGRNPVAEVTSPDYSSLFVVNQDDNNVTQFVIGIDGKLYPYNTVNTPGVFPMGMVMNKSYAYVLDLYQPLPVCLSPAPSAPPPCSGSIGVFPIIPATRNTAISMGTPIDNGGLTYWPLNLPSKPNDLLVPTAINVLASGAYVYATAYDYSVTPTVGYIFGFSVGPSGALTPLNGGVPLTAGVQPSAIASDITSKYLYVTDFGTGKILGYAVNSGQLTPLSGSPFPAGNQPAAIVLDPSFPFAYVANSQDSTVTAYSVNNGELSLLGTYTTGLQPVAIGVDPSTNHFLYTVNFLGNNVSNFQLNQTNGSLLYGQFSPYGSNPLPTAVAAIPHVGTGSGVSKTP